MIANWLSTCSCFHFCKFSSSSGHWSSPFSHWTKQFLFEHANPTEERGPARELSIFRVNTKIYICQSGQYHFWGNKDFSFDKNFLNQVLKWELLTLPVNFNLSKLCGSPPSFLFYPCPSFGRLWRTWSCYFQSCFVHEEEKCQFWS